MPINILHEETQLTVTEWATDTFGEPDNTMAILDRMMEEIKELKWELIKELGEGGNARAVGRELADVTVFIYQLAQHSGIDLFTEIDDKMSINRSRNWVVTENGVGQHV